MSEQALKSHHFYILLALADGNHHGLAIARDVQAQSDGRVRLWPATLYGSLEELRARRWIEEVGEPSDSERKRYYRLTHHGRAVLTDEADRLGKLARVARARVRARTGGA